jgi:O-antigen/teichoic acid export membrane protein
LESQPKPLNIKKNMLYNTAGSLIYQGCLWITTVLVVILANSYSDSGILSFAMTIGNMFSAVSTYNMRTYQVSDIKNKYSQRNYVGFRILTIAIGLLLLDIYSLFVSPDSQTFIAVLAYLLFKTDESFCDVLYGVDQRGERMDYIGVSQLLRGIIVIISFSFGLWITKDIVIAILVMYPACLLVTLLYDIPHARRLTQIKPRLLPKQGRTLLVKCLPLVLEILFLSMVVSVARQYYANAFGNERLGIYSAIATPAVLVQAAARFLYAPALVPLAEKWNDSPLKAFVSSFKKTMYIMLAVMLTAIPLLSIIGPSALSLVYGQKVEGYTYLFTNVLISTGSIAILYYLTDVLVLIRNIRGSLISTTLALITSIVLMIPLETIFDMQGINYTVIIASLVGITVAFICLKKKISESSSGNS